MNLDEKPSKGYFAILHLYGPTETAMDKSWKPGDIEPLTIISHKPANAK